MRKLTLSRQLSYKLLKPIANIIITFIWKTCRVLPIEGESYLENLKNSGQSIIPCYWHQRQIFCVYYFVHHLQKSFKMGILVSPSVDGEVAAQFLTAWGLHVIRGSSTRTGARAMKDLYMSVKQHKLSPAATPDGPKGPLYEFKSGMVLLSQLTQAPIVPITYAADRYWSLKTWDRFIIPKPFARIRIMLGAPMNIPKNATTQEQEIFRKAVEQQMNKLMDQADNSFT